MSYAPPLFFFLRDTQYSFRRMILELILVLFDLMWPWFSSCQTNLSSVKIIL
jgi:hypothetical protein